VDLRVAALIAEPIASSSESRLQSRPTVMAPLALRQVHQQVETK
jgi:hypothetical protein